MKEKRYLCDWKDGKNEESIAKAEGLFFVRTLFACVILSYSVMMLTGLWVPAGTPYPEELYKELEETFYEYIDEGKSFDFMGLQNDPRGNCFNSYIYSDHAYFYFGRWYHTVQHRLDFTISPDYHITSIKRVISAENWEFHRIVKHNLLTFGALTLVFDIALHYVVKGILLFSKARKHLVTSHTK